MNPFKRKAEQPSQQFAIILDTCALIDARVVDIAKAGFVPENIIIPQFIIAELQFLADHGDSHKRERARHGLDIIRELQDLKRIEISIAREQFKDIKEVDDKLIALAKARGAMLYTTDYNLNKVAQIEGVTVLNVNELAQALRPRRLPGERIELKITNTGQDKTQGVGYLDDGTMVVVEKAGNKIGQRIVVEFSRMLQTQAGKMMFAVLSQGQQQKPTTKKPQPEKSMQQTQPHSEKKHDNHVQNVQAGQKSTMTVYHARPKTHTQKQQVAKSKHLEQPHTAHQHSTRQQVKPKARPNAKTVKVNERPSQGQPQPQRTNQPRKRRQTPEDALLKALEHLQ